MHRSSVFLGGPEAGLPTGRWIEERSTRKRSNSSIGTLAQCSSNSTNLSGTSQVQASVDWGFWASRATAATASCMRTTAPSRRPPRSLTLTLGQVVVPERQRHLGGDVHGENEYAAPHLWLSGRGVPDRPRGAITLVRGCRSLRRPVGGALPGPNDQHRHPCSWRSWRPVSATILGRGHYARDSGRSRLHDQRPPGAPRRDPNRLSDRISPSQPTKDTK